VTLLASYVTIAYYDIDFTGGTPRWNYLVAAIGLFIYLHLDCLDGKQARNTGTSSPLGQLFDHGCDAFAVHLVLLTMMTSLQLAHDWKVVVSLLYVFIPWWLAHWEEYHTGVMVYGSGLWGVTEALYAVFGIHMYTYFVGPSGWTWKPFAQSFTAHDLQDNVVSQQLAAMPLNEVLLVVCGVCGMGLFWQQVSKVYRLSGSRILLKTTLPPDERGSKQLGRWAATSHLLQILWTCIGCGTLLMLPVVPKQHSRILFEIYGINYALQATRLILAHMAKVPFHVAVWPNVLIAGQLANHFLELHDPVEVAYGVLACILVGYVVYITRVIGEICRFLGIKALSIPVAKKKAA
jgi:ethanolaminephosphotransferase